MYESIPEANEGSEIPPRLGTLLEHRPGECEGGNKELGFKASLAGFNLQHRVGHRS
jgi:hypothetical protein